MRSEARKQRVILAENLHKELKLFAALCVCVSANGCKGATALMGGLQINFSNWANSQIQHP